MNHVAVAFSIAVPAAFAAGIIVHKYVLSEVERIKTAISTVVLASESRIRADIVTVLAKAKSDVGQIASKL
jgi:hypothetical protein